MMLDVRIDSISHAFYTFAFENGWYWLNWQKVYFKITHINFKIYMATGCGQAYLYILKQLVNKLLQ